MNELKFDYTNSLVKESEIKEVIGGIGEYLSHMSSVSKNKENLDSIEYSEDESSVNLPFDTRISDSVKGVIEKTRSKSLKYIIVVGIGGSNLGTKAILDSLGLHGPLAPLLPKSTPNIIFADTVSSKLLSEIKIIIEKNIVSPEEILINVISKSGSTTETIANFEVIYSALSARFEKINSRVVVTTTVGSKLWELSSKLGFELLSMPKKVGGRYSVFSSVGIFPFMLAGVDTDSLLKGAQVMHDRCVGLSTDNNEYVMDNPALVSAVLIYLHSKSGVSIDNTFVFNPHLESIGKWYRQLMGESIGKRYGIDGKEVNAGVTPIVSVGSTDLHSMAQLYLGGPKDKFTTFVYGAHEKEEIEIPDNLVLGGLVDGIKDKKLSGIMNAIFEGVQEAYKKDKIPFMDVSIEKIDEYSIGQFLQFKMFEMMYLAKLFGVNAFDQPDVEDYKLETRDILGNA